MAAFLLRILVVAVSCSIILSDDIYGPWEEWSSCYTTQANLCGKGTRWRFRDCIDWSAYLCENTFETKPCKVPCKVDGKWSAWKPWGTCSVTCGGGSQSRSRTCSNPAPENGGKNCTGPESESRSCALFTCSLPPINGNWSAWSNWGSCSRSCGNGTQSRSRTCTNPRPANGGSSCTGPYSQTQDCNIKECLQRCKDGEHVYDKCGQRCVCSSAGNLTQCTRIRKEFTSMTTAERVRYIQVVKTASTDAKYKSRYDALITIHTAIFNGFGIHDQMHFLTWHRWYLLQYENLLREVDCNFTVSYWDWSVVSGRPWDMGPGDLWFNGTSGFGGDGVLPFRCVKTGPFREGLWQLIPSARPPRCLKRRFNRIPPDSVAVTLVLDIPAVNFRGFEIALRINLHNSVHCFISGTMCSLESASAPEFFLHHGFVDKIWEDWQNKSTVHRNAFFLTLNSPLPRTNGHLPRHVIDNAALPGGVRVEYRPVKKTVASNVVKRLRSLNPKVLRRIPREGFSPNGKDSFDMFNVSSWERAEAKKINSKLQPINRSIPPKKAAKVDQKLGFDHRIIEEMSPG